MEEKKDFTMMFKKEKKPEPLSKEETIKQVVKALEEKKYNVVDQLTGYLLSGDPTYITSHNNARNRRSPWRNCEILFEEKINWFYYSKFIK